MARLVRATRGVDGAWRLFDRLRSRLVLSRASDRFLGAYNDVAYGRSDRYILPAADAALMPWEDQAIARFFPPPPARLLIGGAGGGREAFALASRGYLVVAFDPSGAMVESLANQAGPELPIEAFRGAFEDLPRLRPARAPGDASPIDLRETGGFDAAILGLSSFSHVRHDADRLRVLRQIAELTRGPILVSFFHRSQPTAIAPHAPASRPGWLRRQIARHLPVPEGDHFGMDIGYYHAFSREELASLIERASLRLVHLDLEANWCHAIVTRGDGNH